MLDTTRAYVSTKVDEAEEPDELARRHALYICTALESTSRVIGDEEAPPLAEHVGNVRAAFSVTVASA